MAARLGVEPDMGSIDTYLSQEISVGKSKEQVFALLDKAKPDSIVRTHALADEDTVPNGACYKVTFDTTLDGYCVLNRYMCFDGKGVLFSVVHELELW